MEADPLDREQKRGIPSLDGLRALSILLVLVGHSGVGIAGATTLGSFGVRVFFVISGYLITTLLLSELDRKGRIDLRHFYFRRTLRIFPPYYALIAVVAILDLGNMLSGAQITYWPAVSYTSNWFATGSWWLGHSWSLSVEEQFYRIWPLTVSIAGRARSLALALAMLAGAPLLRCAIYLGTRNGAVADNFNFDFIAAGCALAILTPQLEISPRWQRLMRSPVPMLLTCVAIGLHSHIRRVVPLAVRREDRGSPANRGARTRAPHVLVYRQRIWNSWSIAECSTDTCRRRCIVLDLPLAAADIRARGRGTLVRANRERARVWRDHILLHRTAVARPPPSPRAPNIQDTIESSHSIFSREPRL